MSPCIGRGTDVPFDQLVGPFGALILAASAAGALWVQHQRDDKQADVEHAEILAYERARTAAAEAQLRDLGTTLKKATDVMDKSVTLTTKLLEELGGN